jgi:predicted RNA-binding protein with RPS1 domain
MKVFLKQSGHGWIHLCVETSNVCTIIHTSVTFDPYERLYIWLGQIRDSQLPVSMIIDEEGYGVELIVEPDKNDTVFFHIEPWFSSTDRITCGKEIINRRELIRAFHNGIVDFINNDFISSNWASIDYLSYQNWDALLRDDLKPQNWEKRLLIAGFEIFKSENYPDVNTENIPEKYQLTADQKSILTLKYAIQRIAIANRNYSQEIKDFTSLYHKLPEDIILNEVDIDWYQEHRAKLNTKYDKSWEIVRKKSDRYLNLHKFRLESLKIGQVVDGTIVGIRDYGVFVDFGGCRGLLHISEISQLEIEHPNRIFAERDWVRAIIIDLDIDRRRVTLSTSILELESGDMLKEPWKVYEKAEEMAARYHQNVLSKIVEVD